MTPQLKVLIPSSANGKAMPHRQAMEVSPRSFSLLLGGDSKEQNATSLHDYVSNREDLCWQTGVH